MAVLFQDLDIFPPNPINNGTYLLYGAGTGSSRHDFQLDVALLFSEFRKRIDAEKYQVNDVWVTASSDTPQMRGYNGTWKKIDGDASIMTSGSNTPVSTTPVGENNPLVPVQQHTHTAAFSGYQLPAHYHPFTTHSQRGEVGHNAGNPPAGIGENFGAANWNGMSSVSAGVPAGSVAVYNTGTPNATLDVRGSRVNLNFWLRTN